MDGQPLLAGTREAAIGGGGNQNVVLSRNRYGAA